MTCPTKSWGLASTLSLAMISALAAPDSVPPRASFPALERPAAHVRSPGRAVLLAADVAGARVVAVGERGVVALSDDSGKSWRQAASVPVAVSLTSVRFVDASRGWAVGHGGVILHTTDAGDHWQLQADGRALARAVLNATRARASAAPDDEAAAMQLKAAQALVDDGPDKPLLDLWFADALNGFVVGAYGLFFETNDGGRTWLSIGHRLNNPKLLHLYAVRGKGSTVIVAGEQGQLHRSADGGRSFSPLHSPYVGSWFGIAFETERTLVLAGLRGSAFRTEDQGRSWSRMEGTSTASIVDVSVRRDGTLQILDQSGQLLTALHSTKLQRQNTPPLPQANQLLSLPDGTQVVVGFSGAMHLPAHSPIQKAVK